MVIILGATRWGYLEEAYSIAQLFSVRNFDALLKIRLTKFKVPMIRLATACVSLRRD